MSIGRAGNKGTAYTFITPDEEAYAEDMMRALKSSKQQVPPELQQMVESFNRKVEAGLEKRHSSGYSGKGFKFDESEMSEQQKAKDMQRKEYELAAGLR